MSYCSYADDLFTIKKLRYINYDAFKMYAMVDTYDITIFGYDNTVIVKIPNEIYNCGNNYENNYLAKECWENVEITKLSLDSKYVCIFYYDELSSWFAFWKPSHIVKIVSKQTRTPECIFPGNIYFSEDELCMDTDNLNESYVYHLLFRHKNFRKFGYSEKNCEEKITTLWMSDVYMNLVSDNYVFPKEKINYFSCLDELCMSLELMNNEAINNKTLDSNGYFIKIINNKKRYSLCKMEIKIFNYILEIMPKYKNQYVNYLTLYQNNKLNDIIVYLHKYPNDVIKRINISIKTLAKEILNIYHLTRKKQNSDMYYCLSQSYKKVLYDLHKIYVNQKFDSENDINEILIEKKSISVDVVYNYLKDTNTDDLLRIFFDRDQLIEKLKNNNFNFNETIYANNINIITQIELMRG